MNTNILWPWIIKKESSALFPRSVGWREPPCNRSSSEVPRGRDQSSEEVKPLGTAGVVEAELAGGPPYFGLAEAQEEHAANAATELKMVLKTLILTWPLLGGRVCGIPAFDLPSITSIWAGSEGDGSSSSGSGGIEVLRRIELERAEWFRLRVCCDWSEAGRESNGFYGQREGERKKTKPYCSILASQDSVNLKGLSRVEVKMEEHRCVWVKHRNGVNITLKDFNFFCCIFLFLSNVIFSFHNFNCGWRHFLPGWLR